MLIQPFNTKRQTHTHPRTTPQQMHVYEVYFHEVYRHEMHVRKVLAKALRFPILQTMWWSICRDLSCKIRVFALRGKRSPSASVCVVHEFCKHSPTGAC